MAFGDHETSKQLGRPIDLYTFTLSATNIVRLTNSLVDVTVGIDTWLSAEVSRDQPTQNDDSPGSQLEVLFGVDDPAANSFVTQWIASAPEVDRIRVLVERFHIDAGGGSTPWWLGFLTSVGYEEDGNVASVLCQSLDNRFTLIGPRRNWGTVCNHKHLDQSATQPTCQLNPATFTQQGTVTAIDSTGTVFTVPGIGAPTVRWDGGTFRANVGLAKRLIESQSGDDFTVRYPIPEIQVGTIVDIQEGCRRDLTDCNAYSNVPNFGGTPYTPTRNPFTNRIDFL